MSVQIKKIETYISRKMETRRNSSKEITEISNKECDKGRQSRDMKGMEREIVGEACKEREMQ